MHYGDHHPMATRTLLGFKDETEAEDVALDPDSIGFITYYAAQGINYRVPALPQYETLDVAYLGTVMLDLAGLPLSDSHRERKRLMTLVQGALLRLLQAGRDPAVPPPPDRLRRHGGALMPGAERCITVDALPQALLTPLPAWHSGAADGIAHRVRLTP